MQLHRPLPDSLSRCADCWEPQPPAETTNSFLFSRSDSHEAPLSHFRTVTRPRAASANHRPSLGNAPQHHHKQVSTTEHERTASRPEPCTAPPLMQGSATFYDFWLQWRTERFTPRPSIVLRLNKPALQRRNVQNYSIMPQFISDRRLLLPQQLP